MYKLAWHLLTEKLRRNMSSAFWLVHLYRFEIGIFRRRSVQQIYSLCITYLHFFHVFQTTGVSKITVSQTQSIKCQWFLWSPKCRFRVLYYHHSLWAATLVTSLEKFVSIWHNHRIQNKSLWVDHNNGYQQHHFIVALLLAFCYHRKLISGSAGIEGLCCRGEYAGFFFVVIWGILDYCMVIHYTCQICI
jgi:hypothetical protein